MVLRAGQHPLPQGFINTHRRQRVVIAMAEVVHERGFAEATIARVIERAQMSRNTFYDIFDDRSESLRFCFAAAFEQTFGPAKAAGEVPGMWTTRVAASLDALFGAMIEQPLLAELCLVHSGSAGPDAEGLDSQAGLEILAGILAGGREAGRAALGDRYHDSPPGVDEFLAGSILTLATRLLREDKVEQLPSRRDELLSLIATPFFGVELAGELSDRLEAA